MTKSQTPRPLPTPLAMSSRIPDPPISEPTPIPKPHQISEDKPSKDRPFPTPKLRFEIRDLHHSGAIKFQSEIRILAALEDAIETVLTLLYGTTTTRTKHPHILSVKFVLKSMDGVAYTANELDDQHKEINLSLEYIDKQPANLLRHEILGVIVHEMVHVWQWNALGTCPGGLIEGLADYVRLKSGYAPLHWTRVPGVSWDAGYERTGFFLEWLEEGFGAGKVMELNGVMRNEKYDGGLWERLFGKSVEALFADYKAECEKVKA